jgi:hypothetical protein
MKLLNNIPVWSIKVATLLLSVLAGFAGNAQTGVQVFDGTSALETVKGEHFASRHQPGAVVRVRKAGSSDVSVGNSLYRVGMEATLLNRGGLTAGTNNIFANVGEGANAERVDYIAPAGYTIVAAGKEGFVVADGGAEHEAFCVAAITAVDNAGEPVAFSKVLQVNSSAYGPDIAGAAGVLVRFADLGLTSGTAVYGYSVMAGDVTGTPVNKWKNYPNNTDMVVGGLDMLGVTGFYVLSDKVAPVVKDIEVTALGMQPVRVKATSAAEAGEIAFYTLVRVPKMVEGFLCYTDGNNIMPASIGKRLTVAQMRTLTFCGTADYAGDAGFEYTATNEAGLMSNTAYGTVHVQPVQTTSMEPAVRVQQEGVKF